MTARWGLLLVPSFVFTFVLLAAKFKGDYTVRHHLAPPLFSKREPETGH